MAKVNLFFETFPDPELFQQIVRLKCGVQLKIKEGWTQPHSAIIDSGAHTSVVPSFLWKTMTYEVMAKNCTIFGLSKKQECGLSGTLARITLLLIDEYGNQTKELSAPAFLAETDQIPLMLGFNGILEALKVYFDFRARKAYVED